MDSILTSPVILLTFKSAFNFLFLLKAVPMEKTALLPIEGLSLMTDTSAERSPTANVVEAPVKKFLSLTTFIIASFTPACAAAMASADILTPNPL